MQRVSDALMKGLALCVILIGVQGAIKTTNMILVILCIVVGTVIGELCCLEYGMEMLGNKLERATKGRFGEVTRGFVSASLLFCVGSMAIVGSLNSGLVGDHTMQYTKALIDMCVAVVFASTMGFGVLFSSALILLYQGSITLLATLIAPYLTEYVITEMTAVGSLLIMGLGMNMLGLTKLKIMNHLPAVFLPLLFCLFI